MKVIAGSFSTIHEYLSPKKTGEAVASAGFEELQAALATGAPTFLDSYAATNRAEYFAVSCEAFFEIPDELKHFHPDLYQCLTQLFHVDPANWISNRR